MSKIKGQNFRAFAALPPSDSYVAVAEATNCSITQQGNTEDTTTKDTEGLYSQETVVSTSWSVQVDTYQSATEQLRSIIFVFNSATPTSVGWDQTAGTNNRTAQNASFKRSGYALLNDFTMNFNDRETVAVSLQFQGTGGLS